jgi:hypothetical protein
VFREFDAIPSRMVSVYTSGDIWNTNHQTPGSHRPPSPTHETSLLREPFEHRQFVKTTRWPHPPIYHSCICDKPDILTYVPLDEFRLVDISLAMMVTMAAACYCQAILYPPRLLSCVCDNLRYSNGGGTLLPHGFEGCFVPMLP